MVVYHWVKYIIWIWFVTGSTFESGEKIPELDVGKMCRRPLEVNSPSPIASMYGIYANIWGILMGSMLPYIPAPWIRHGSWFQLSVQDLLHGASESAQCNAVNPDYVPRQNWETWDSTKNWKYPDWWFGTWFLWLSIQLGMSSSQLTNSCFSEG